MSEITVILSAIHDGDPAAAEQLLALVYDELRQLAAQKLAHEKPGQTLDPTALVHEACLRLVATGKDAAARASDPGWANRRHFFAAAAEAMRRILVENARRKGRDKHGGDLRRHDVADHEPAIAGPDPDVLAVDEALAQLAAEHPEKAKLVELRYFAGLTLAEA